MALFPLVCNLQGDYGYKVIIADDGDTIGDVIRMTNEQVAGVLVEPFPEGTVLKARLQDEDDPLDEDLVIKDAGFMQMEALVIYAEA